MFSSKMLDACKSVPELENIEAIPIENEIWCQDKNIVRGKKLCSFILFALKFHLIFDPITHIMQCIYEYVNGYGATVSTFGGKVGMNKTIIKQNVDGPLSTASFDNPFGIHFDKDNNMWISEFGSHTIRIISPKDYCVKTIFGKIGVSGNENGIGTESTFWIPVQFCEDRNGNFIVVDSFNNNYRRITLVDGQYNVTLLDLKGNEVNACHDMDIDHDGDLVASDTCGHRIIKIVGADEQFVSYSGPNYARAGYKDGPVSEALWNKPAGIIVDRQGNIVVCDYQNHCIRRIDTKTNVVSTIGGKGRIEGFKDGYFTDTLFCHPNSCCLGLDDNILVADTDNNCIRQISGNGFVTTIAGIPKGVGTVDGPGHQATFNYPVNICIDYRGDIFVADWKNNILRKITYAY